MIKLPFFGRIYDGSDFLEYPKTLGWDVEWLTNWDWIKRGKCLQEVHSFLQAWLFFGLLEHVMGMPILASEFIYEGADGKEYITTAPLSGYAERWKRRDYASIKDDDKKEILRTTTPYLQMANRVVLSLWQRFGTDKAQARGQEHFDLSPELLLSLQLLGAALTNARAHVYYDSFWHIKEKASFYYQWGNSRLMQSHMLKLGWCRSVAVAFMSKDLDVQCFAASLEPPKVKKDHSECSERICLGNQVLEHTYEVKHASGNCQCNFVGPNIDSLVSIVRQGQKPLIVFPATEIDLTTCGSLDLITHQSGMPYLAFSHVWKDGLGNPFQNLLPKCQIQRLANLVRVVHAARKNDAGGMSSNDIVKDSPGSEALVPIWIDTLCVPVEKKHKVVRNIAIGAMRQIYQGADTVLVMDDDLQQIPLYHTSWKRSVTERVELMFRFSMCGWSSRLWTYEEGRLAKDVYLLLKDGIIRGKDLMWRSSTDLHMLQAIQSEASSLLHEIVLPEWTAGNQELSLGHIITGLKSRQTSRSFDETLCISHMLDTDTNELLLVKPELRMRTFLASLQYIPPGLLFMGEPRLAEKGYRWAPTSFLHRQEKCYENERLYVLPRHPLPGRPAAVLMRDGSGLKIMSPGIQLGLFAELPEDERFGLMFSSPRRPAMIAQYDRDPTLEAVHWKGVRATHVDRVAALLLPCHAVDYYDPVDCVLVAILEDDFEDDFIRCNVVCSFQICQSWTSTGSAVNAEDLQTLTGAIWLPYPQTWIVD